MHGLIHVIFKGFVVDNFGDAAWAEILKRAGIEDDSTILEMKQYDDELTLAAIKIGSEVAGAPVDTALELFGGYFVEFATNNGFSALLKSLGSNLYEFLSNLNILHHNIERDFTSAIFPLVEVKEGNGTPGDDEYSFSLYYASSRPGMHPVLRGALVKASSMLFDSDLEISEPMSTRASFVEGSEGQVSFTFDLKVTKRAVTTVAPVPKEITHSSFLQAAAVHGHVASVPPPEPQKQEQKSTASSFSFFDLHAALSSIWSCSCKCENDASANRIDLWKDTKEASEEPWVKRVAAALFKQKAHVDEVCASYPRPEAGKHPYFALNAKDRIKVGAALFRGVEASVISGAWSEEEDLVKATDFWGAYDKLDSYYDWSRDWFKPGGVKDSKIRFLSQSWGVPKEWDSIMGTGSSYAQAKAAEICCVSKDIAARELGDVAKWTQVGYWLDKCCIPQGDTTIMSWCVNLLEEFIVFSDGLIVLLPWSYFTRLWCVYEWVCFLLVHDPMDIEICADPFIRDSTIPLYIETIKNFKLANCQCYHEPDRQILLDKVAVYYKTPAAFEKFLKLTSIALFARCVASRRSGKAAAAMKPWQELAKDAGFDELEKKLNDMVSLLPKWRASAVSQAKGGGTHDVQTATVKEVDGWFRKEVVPIVTRARAEAAAEKGLAYIQELRNAAKGV